MSKKIDTKPPAHFYEHIARIRQWIDGFQAAGGKGPANQDTLRQIQVWLADQAKPHHLPSDREGELG
jgi:hypothetical protein